MTDEMKSCSKCGEVKPISRFSKHIHAPDGHRGTCKACDAAYSRDNRSERRGRERANYDPVKAAKKWQEAYARNGEKWAANKRRKFYGDDGESLWRQQDGKCEICGRELIRGHGGNARLDHCHESGVVRAWLCHSCNISLGHFNDDPVLIRAAADYVERFSVFK